MNIKPIEQSADKWLRRATVAGPDYENGVSNPRVSWSQAASAAENNYKAGVAAAAAAGRYSGGIRRAGDTKWRNNAVAKGAVRFADGVRLATGEWQSGFAPFQSALSGLTLPPRGPAGSPQNLQRVQQVDTTLRQVKERMGGAAK